MKRFMKGFMISSKICKIYEELALCALDNEEEGSLYEEKLEDLRELICKEDEVYALLTLDEVNNYLSEVKLNSLTDQYIRRYHSKLIYRKNTITASDLVVSGFSLDSVINSKILIDTIKKTNDTINNMETFDESEELFLDDLKAYHNTFKYTLCGDNEFIEKVGLFFKFDISKLPVLSMKSIKGLFNLGIIDISQESLFYSACKTIDLVVYSDKSNTVPNVYSALYNVNQLEVLISLLNKKSVAKIIKYYNDCNKDRIKNKVYLRTVREVISKRRSELI